MIFVIYQVLSLGASCEFRLFSMEEQTSYHETAMMWAISILSGLGSTWKGPCRNRKCRRNPQPFFTEVTVHRHEMEKGQKSLSLVLILL